MVIVAFFNKSSIFANTIKLYNYECGINTIEYPVEFRSAVGACEAVISKKKLKLESMIWNETDEENIEISAVQKKIVNERLQLMNHYPADCKSWEEIESNLNL